MIVGAVAIMLKMSQPGVACCNVNIAPTNSLAHVNQVNDSIQSLSLEWNSIGTVEQGIQRFADGLEINGSLTQLILCNNHVNAQVGCAELIAYTSM